MLQTAWGTKWRDRQRHTSARLHDTMSLAPYSTTYRGHRGVRKDTVSLRGLLHAFRPVARQRPLPHSSTSRIKASPEAPLLAKHLSTQPRRGSEARHVQLRTAQGPGPTLMIQRQTGK
ncbi:hypothetical protein FQN60_002395 [Etheostoma spectabile]|uniref:Uncharacterized protein n=1 Tax=Etheostoma spectabile TaxID=54343 RepID=A0A5J5D9T9_9PERO|nr:hypothetical protein FQN60_002395 [Etheostoma spectabile]